jgi:hypothetical protein
LQDITRFNEGKSDMRDGLVNWSKFSQLGTSAAVVIDCPRLAPDIPHDAAVEKLIMSPLVLNLDDDVSQRNRAEVSVGADLFSGPV